MVCAPSGATLSLAPTADVAKYAADLGAGDTGVNKRPGHVTVTTEVGFCSFCGRPRNLRREDRQLGALVRTIVTCETCHRTLSSTVGVAPEPVAPESESSPEPTAAAPSPKPPAARPAAQPKPAAAAAKAPAPKGRTLKKRS